MRTLCGSDCIYVSTHSHPKVAATQQHTYRFALIVSTHSHPKVAATLSAKKILELLFQHTATRRWLRALKWLFVELVVVSTHSHPKVAAIVGDRRFERPYCFNTQPPEGGCN